VSTSPPEEDQGISSRASKMHQTGKAAKVKSLSEDEVIRLSSGPASCTLLSYRKTVAGSNSSLIPYSNSPVSSSTMELGKHPRDDEIHKKTMTSKHASFPSSKGESFSPPLLPFPFFYFLLTFMIHVLIPKNRISSGG